jgi:hypothetical protein
MRVFLCALFASAAACSGSGTVADNSSAVSQKCTGTSCGLLSQIASAPTYAASTVPENGDINPYGVAFVPSIFPAGGHINAGDILVGNFNNSGNAQGTGTTIVRINRGGPPTLFYQDDTIPGISTALGVLSAGFVVVGNVPSTDGSGVCNDFDTDAGAGELTVLDSSANVVARLVSPIFNGPWDLTVYDQGSSGLIFVSNVKSGAISRISYLIVNGQFTAASTQIASGYPSGCDPNAFVVGPTGLAYDPDNDLLYVASTVENAIFTVASAGNRSLDQGKGDLLIQDNTHFHGPLGMARAQNGDLIIAQGDAVNFFKGHPSEIVEVTSSGAFVGQFSVDHLSGSAFGLALESAPGGSRFIAVDDGKNLLDVWNFR